MNWLSSKISFRSWLSPSGSVEKRSTDGSFDLAQPPQWLLKSWGIQTHLEGIGCSVSLGQAIGISSLFSCVRKMSNDLASIPLEIVKKTGVTTEIDTTHPSYNLVHREPNPRDTAMDFWSTLLAYSLLKGQGIALITRDRNAAASRLRHVRKEDIKVTYLANDDMVLFYDHRKYGTYSEIDVLRINNFLGTDVVKQFNQLLGLSISAEQYASLYFANANSASGYLYSESNLRDDQRIAAKESWNDVKGDKAHSTPLMPFAVKYQEIKKNTPMESQLVESRNAQGLEICRLFNMPPSLVGFETAAKYESVEAQNGYYVTHVLRPFAKKVEQECDRKLLRESEKLNNSHSFKYNFNALLRGDTKARTEYYDKMVKMGVLSINEVRSMENMNPVENGDDRLVQINQIPLSSMSAYADKITQQNPS